MEGIASLLDNKHDHLIKTLWSELENSLGLRGVYITPFPHFSYHVAQDYNQVKLEPILKRISQATQEFRVTASGLGIFSGQPPVLYIPVVRTPGLSRLHEALWYEIAHVASDTSGYYHPDNWLPHLTLAFGDTHKDNLAEAIRLLSERPLNWEIPVNNLAFIEETAQGQKVRFRFNFGE
jgi:2'-5' RNA ligase